MTLKSISVKLLTRQIRDLDEMVQAGDVASRNEAIRKAVDLYLDGGSD